MLYVRATLAAVILAAAFFLGAAQAQTIGCSGPTGGNCVPTVPFTTTANGTATAVDVNSWGFQQ